MKSELREEASISLESPKRKIALKGYILSVYLSGGLTQGKMPVITGYTRPKVPFSRSFAA